MLSGQGTPYSVFTPFKKKWIENFDVEYLDIDFEYQAKKLTSISSNIKDFNFNFSREHAVKMTMWQAGEKEAEKKLLYFLKTKVSQYAKDRNDPIIDGTSRISPYLALGVISAKKCILEALKINNFELTSGNKGIPNG